MNESELKKARDIARQLKNLSSADPEIREAAYEFISGWLVGLQRRVDEIEARQKIHHRLIN